MSDRFSFYHVGIFFLDDTGQFAVLQASNSEGGRRMLERGHKLEVGESGIVGHVAKFGTPRIALDVGLDAVFFNNHELPNTRSEMALPLATRGRTLGVLDVQSEKPGAFSEGHSSIMSILADQIAIAVENARLFQKTQQALNEYQSLYQQNVWEGWTFREGNTRGRIQTTERNLLPDQVVIELNAKEIGSGKVWRDLNAFLRTVSQVESNLGVTVAIHSFAQVKPLIPVASSTSTRRRK